MRNPGFARGGGCNSWRVWASKRGLQDAKAKEITLHAIYSATDDRLMVKSPVYLPRLVECDAKKPETSMSTKSAYSASDGSSPSVQERGSLRTCGDGRSQFIGSASGIYFVSTVRQAFADADTRFSSADLGHPSPEDCILPDEDDDRQAGRQSRGRAGGDSTATSRVPSPPPGAPPCGPDILAGLGRTPPREAGRRLFMAYFQTWHRFFPFLHGPTVKKDLESLYGATTKLSTTQQGPSEQPLAPARVIILQCLFNLASLHSDVELPAASRIDDPARILPYLPGLAMKGGLVSIQALVAVLLLLAERMSFRAAASVAGLLSRTIFLAGLHRCPTRYPELSPDDCDIRKRLFWTIYVLDRFLSQTLGHPLGIQDSDIDVCPPAGPELHSPNRHSIAHHRPHGPMAACSYRPFPEAPPTSRGHGDAVDQVPSVPGQKARRHLILAFQVEYSRLTGRALELFHKSIHVRSIDPDTVLSLRTDLDAWWNSVPSDLRDFDVAAEGNVRPSDPHQSFNPAAFFMLLHSQLRLLIHRPWLSLEPSTAEFQSALQICIGVSRDIIVNMKKQHGAGYAIFWPGYLSVAWMAGIILAFACHLQLYSSEKGRWYV